MQENAHRYTVKKMAAVFGVSRSAYYQWMRNGVSQRREQADQVLVRLIREIVLRHHRRYGSPRVRQELRNAYGKRLSLKRVARLMRENSLNAKRRRTFIPTTDRKHRLYVGETILNRQFHAERGIGHNLPAYCFWLCIPDGGT